MSVHYFKVDSRILFLISLHKRQNWRLYLWDGEKLEEGQCLGRKKIRLKECRFDGKFFKYSYYDLKTWMNFEGYSLAPNFTAISWSTEDFYRPNVTKIVEFKNEKAVAETGQFPKEKPFTLDDHQFDFSQSKFENVIAKPYQRPKLTFKKNN